MSMPHRHITLEEEEEEEGKRRPDVCLGGVQSPATKSNHETQQGLNLDPPHNSTETTPSPSGLLSLPWEIVSRIVSHLPAQCVISVLPQVCWALRDVEKDTSAWQLRAHRLTGPKASFPVGPRDNFDWPIACLEMEQLIERWVGHEKCVTKEMEEREAERKQEMAEEGRGDGEVEGRWEEEEDEEVAAAAMRQQDADQFQELDGGANGVENGQNESGQGRANAVRDGGQSDHVELMDEGKDPPRAPSDLPPSPMQHFTLPSGHVGDVSTILLVGGEGAVCASGSKDRNVNLWDLRQGPRGALLRTLCAPGEFSSHQGWVRCLAYSSPLLSSGSFDGTVRLWDLEAGGVERRRFLSRNSVLCLCCRGDMLLVGSSNHKINIYDTRAPEPLVKSLRCHSDAVYCLTSDEQYVLSSSIDNTVAVFDLKAMKVLQKVRTKSYLRSMSYSGREVWAGDNCGLVHTFSMNEGSLKSIGQFNVGHKWMVSGIHHSPGVLYTCSSDRTLKVHLPCAPPKTLYTHQLPGSGGVNGLTVEAGVLAVASGDENIEVWRPRQ